MVNEDYALIVDMASPSDVSISTAFDWRHKILLLLPEVSDKLEGEVEVNDLWIRYSQKGIPQEARKD